MLKADRGRFFSLLIDEFSGYGELLRISEAEVLVFDWNTNNN